MRAEGLEPPSSYEHRHLKPACVPVPARPRGEQILGLRRMGRHPIVARLSARFYACVMAVGEIRPGYELWRPNREKPQAITTKAVMILLLLATAGVCLLVTIGGFSLLEGGAAMGLVCFIYAALYVLFAFMVTRWSRGALPVSAAFSILLLIFAAVAAPSWFARDKAGFDDPLFPVPLIGLLLLILIPLQAVVIAVAMIGFNQDWHVEEERPIGSGEDYGAEPPPDEGSPQLA
jgi:hypothetical protein